MDKLEEFKKEVAVEINKLLAKISMFEEEQSKKVEWPKYGDKVFLLYPDSDIIESIFNIERRRVSLLGLIFKTREEAEKERDRRAAEVRVLRRLRELEPEGYIASSESRYEKYFLGVNIMSGLISINREGASYTQHHSKYSTQDACIKVANEMPEDIKTMLGVISKNTDLQKEVNVKTSIGGC